MKKLFLITLLTFSFAAPALADTISTWCPDDAVCSQQRNKRIIVYDPNGYFRQATLATNIVPVSERTLNAAKYGNQEALNEVATLPRQSSYTREYYFRTAGGY